MCFPPSLFHQWGSWVLTAEKLELCLCGSLTNDYHHQQSGVGENARQEVCGKVARREEAHDQVLEVHAPRKKMWLARFRKSKSGPSYHKTSNQTTGPPQRPDGYRASQLERKRVSHLKRKRVSQLERKKVVAFRLAYPQRAKALPFHFSRLPHYENAHMG